MAWTSPKTWNVREKVTATLLNLHLRDNLAYLKGLLDGTGTDTVVLPSTVKFTGDANFGVERTVSTVPLIRFDSVPSDWLQFDRTTNTWTFVVNGVSALVIPGDTGKLGGRGFYDSGTGVLIAPNANSSFGHGLGAKPRVIFGYWDTVQSEVGDNGVGQPMNTNNAMTNQPYIDAVDQFNIRVQNPVGAPASYYVRIMAMR